MTGKPAGARPAKRATKAMRAAGEYWVVMCANCHHPGGLHVIVEWKPRVDRCRCCAGCALYIDGSYGIWSDTMTHQLATE